MPKRPIMTDPTPRRFDLAALAVVSGSVLAFEIALLRLFEFSHWHHFAGLSIALALLGLGAAGTVLALVGQRALAGGDCWFGAGMLIAAAGFVLVLWLNSRIALRPLLAAWDGTELLRVLAVDLAAFLPFFGAGLAIGQVFPRWRSHTGRLYSVNLIGSGLGAVTASAALAFVSPERAVAALALLLAVAVLLLALARRQRALLLASLLLAMLAGPLAYAPPPPAVSDFKALARLGELPGIRLLSLEFGLSGRLSELRSPSLRIAPGLSLNYTGEVPVRDVAVIGSDQVVVLPSAAPVGEAFRAATLGGLALRLRPTGAVLAVGSSTWSTPLLATGRELSWLEPDRRITELVRSRGVSFRPLSDGYYRYLRTASTRFEVISLDHAYRGGDAAGEAPVLTREGIAAALARLAPGGLLAIPIKTSYPPRDGPRLFATVAAALDRQGAETPAAHVAALRGLQSLLVVVGERPLGPGDLRKIERFAERWSFDRVWLPGIQGDQVNRHHQLNEPLFFQAASAVFGERPMPAGAAWFATEPATLDRPYFWHAMRWSKLPDLYERLGRRVASLLDWTLVMSLAAMIVVSLLAAVLIVLPLGRMPPLRPPLRARSRLAGYFLALGLGFMLVEMAVFQRSVLYLERPLVAATVVFSVFLLGAGAGAAMPPRRSAILRIFGALALAGVLAAAVLWLATDALLHWPEGVRIAALVAALAPLAWAMGRPFPWALAQLVGQPRWMPWGWAINGFASVAAAALAPLVAVHAGQLATLAAGFAGYVVAAGLALSWRGDARPRDRLA